MDFQLKRTKVIIMSILLCRNNYLITEEINLPVNNRRYINANNGAHESEESNSDDNYDMNDRLYVDDNVDGNNSNQGNENHEIEDDKDHENQDNEDGQDIPAIWIKELTLAAYFVSAAPNVRWQWNKL